MRFDLVVNTMVMNAVRDGLIRVNGGGSVWRPLLHVRDAAHSFVAVVEASGEVVRGEVFNVGSRNLRIGDLAQHIAATLGPGGTGIVPHPIHIGVAAARSRDHGSLDQPEVGTRLSATTGYRVSSTKLTTRLGFLPQEELDDSLQEIAVSVRRDTFGDCSERVYDTATRWA
jgi:nucleoside-diphosphate-sugar epimerase